MIATTVPVSLDAVLERARTSIRGFRRVDRAGAPLEVRLKGDEVPECVEVEVLEGGTFCAHRVEPVDGAHFAAFLDGIQESREVAWVGTLPIVRARVGAVVRQREGCRLSTWQTPRIEEGFYASWEGCRELGDLLRDAGFGLREVREAAAPNEQHPSAWLQRAENAVKQDRERIERQLADEFLALGGGPLYIDGPLPNSRTVFESANGVGVVKSHQRLFASGENLMTLLHLGEGERSSVFKATGRHRPAAPASWYLRVRDPAGNGPLWGLVRVEVPFEVFERGGAGAADERSAWVLAEGAPLALPDGRWDTMAYGIRSCEEYLRARFGR